MIALAVLTIYGLVGGLLCHPDSEAASLLVGLGVLSAGLLAVLTIV
jgi:hypothetical protein